MHRLVDLDVPRRAVPGDRGDVARQHPQRGQAAGAQREDGGAVEGVDPVTLDTGGIARGEFVRTLGFGQPGGARGPLKLEREHLAVVTATDREFLVAVEPLEGIEIMARRRGLPAGRRELTNGPGKLCQAFGIDARLYGADLTRRVLYLAEGPSAKVARSRRIGIDYAGAWADKPWRFYDPDSRFVSPVRVQR